MICKYFLPLYGLLFYFVCSVHKLYIFLKFSLSTYCFFAQLLCIEFPVFCWLEEVKADILSLVPDLKGEDFSYFCHLSIMFTMCFLCMVFTKEIISFYYWFVEWFYHERVLNFVTCFSCFSWKKIFFPLHCEACGMSVPWAGIEPVVSTVKTQSPTHWTSRGFPMWFFPSFC